MKFLEENLLEHLKKPEFADLYESMSKQKFSKGEYLCRPDSCENRVFIVASGRARIYLGYEDKEFNLGILSKGDIFSTHTRAFVQSLDNMEVLVTDVANFSQKMLDDPAVTKAMVGILGSMLKISFDIIEGLVFKDVNSRIITLFLNEAEKRGISENNGIIVEIDLSVEQLANMVGSTRQTVSSLINNLSKEGLVIKLERGKYLIPNTHALKTLMNT